MKKLTFTACVIFPDDYLVGRDHSNFAEDALYYGSNHQEFSSYVSGTVTVEDTEEEL